jgi:cyclase
VSRVYDSRNVDELVLLDIRATLEKRSPNLEIISDISSECFMPLTVGGGISTVEQAREVLRYGADKVVINTAAVENPSLISALSHDFGAQCVVVSIDAIKTDDGNYRVCTHSGKQITELVPHSWAVEAEKLGAGEIIINSIDQDGTMKGFDVELVSSVTAKVRIPVVAAGGAGKLEDFAEVIVNSGANAIAAASIYHFTSITPMMVKEYLHELGISTRLSNTPSAAHVDLLATSRDVASTPQEARPW